MPAKSNSELLRDYPTVFASAPDASPIQRSTPKPSSPPPDSDLDSQVDEMVSFMNTTLDIPAMKPKRKSAKVSPRLVGRFHHRETGTQTESRKAVLPRTVFVAPEPRIPLHPSYRIDFGHKLGRVERIQRLQGGIIKTYYQNGAVMSEKSNGVIHLIHNEMKWMRFPNGDELQEFPDGSTAYKYDSNGAVELRLRNGESIIEFSDGQREYRSQNGEVKIVFADGRRATCRTHRPFRRHV
jgi:hypothetical protein